MGIEKVSFGFLRRERRELTSEPTQGAKVEVGTREDVVDVAETADDEVVVALEETTEDEATEDEATLLGEELTLLADDDELTAAAEVLVEDEAAPEVEVELAGADEEALTALRTSAESSSFKSR